MLKIVFALVSILNLISADYCDLNCGDDPNTVCTRQEEKCGLAAECGSSAWFGMTDEDRRAVLDEHNKMRDLTAKGSTELKMQAADMTKLIYSKELEFSAQCLTNTCKLEHDHCRLTPNFNSSAGQNMYMGGFNTENDTKEKLASAIKLYFEEVSEFNPDWVDSYHFTMEAGHFSQAAWAETTHVGCGLTVFDGKIIIACNYGPSGNWEEGRVFKKGTPCSQCPEGYKCDEEYTGLCAKIDQTEEQFVPPFEMEGSRN